MSYFFRFIFCAVLFAISGCTAQQSDVAKSTVPAQFMKLCEQRLEACKRQCFDNCPKCTLAGLKDAQKDYLEYVHDQRVQGGYVSRGLNSYRDPLQCRKVTCNCTADFLTCKQGCAGVIQKRLQAAPYCI
ncbi:hypothetical protein [Legionella worsleiensis]|uniref:Acyltransferase n=1 Tax=Legionella worsleiensis TaxID=45076 RepID=A0A0W1AJ05_9GAMM|nr:hypothetical protein [Legionella worsleiensis]KTD81354.1 acyltransferase [Legionella worsleiensis]STY29944.1 acyltransferase [Legionella worsleiensis]